MRLDAPLGLVVANDRQGVGAEIQAANKVGGWPTATAADTEVHVVSEHCAIAEHVRSIKILAFHVGERAEGEALHHSRPWELHVEFSGLAAWQSYSGVRRDKYLVAHIAHFEVHMLEVHRAGGIVVVLDLVRAERAHYQALQQEHEGRRQNEARYDTNGDDLQGTFPPALHECSAIAWAMNSVRLRALIADACGAAGASHWAADLM